MGKLLNVAEAAELLGVPKSWFYQRSSRREFPAGVMLKVGHYTRYDAEKLLEWIKSGAAAKRVKTSSNRPVGDGG